MWILVEGLTLEPGLDVGELCEGVGQPLLQVCLHPPDKQYYIKELKSMYCNYKKEKQFYYLPSNKCICLDMHAAYH